MKRSRVRLRVLAELSALRISYKSVHWIRSYCFYKHWKEKNVFSPNVHFWHLHQCSLSLWQFWLKIVTGLMFYITKHYRNEIILSPCKCRRDIHVAFQNGIYYWEERIICLPPPPRSKHFPLGADPTEKVDKGTVVEEFLSLKVYPFTLIYCGPTVIDRMSRLISVCLIRICSVYILSYKVPP